MDRRELFCALALLGLDVTRAQSNQLFDAIDANGSGDLDFNEFERAIREGISPAHASRARKRRQQKEQQRRQANDLDSDDDQSTPPQAVRFLRFRRYLARHREALADLLERMDDDGEGRVTKADFRSGWRVIELDAGFRPPIPRDEVDSAFDDMDVSESGALPIAELSDLLLSVVPEGEGYDDNSEDEGDGETTAEGWQGQPVRPRHGAADSLTPRRRRVAVARDQPVEAKYRRAYRGRYSARKPPPPPAGAAAAGAATAGAVAASQPSTARDSSRPKRRGVTWAPSPRARRLTALATQGSGADDVELDRSIEALEDELASFHTETVRRHMLARLTSRIAS